MDILDAINDIEEHFDVGLWRVNEVDIWPWVRISLVGENTTGGGVRQESHRDNLFKRVLSLVKIILSSVYVFMIDYKQSEKIHPADVVFFSSNVTRTVRFPSKQYGCQNLDAIKILLGKSEISYYTMENVDRLPVKYPRYTKSDLLIAWKFFILKFKRKITRYKNSIFLPGFDEVKRYLLENGFECTCINRDIIENTGSSISVLADYFHQVLVKTNAKTGVVVCWYTYIQMAFLKACRMVGIPGIDIQHGLAGENGSATYVKWSNIPDKGFNTMPTHFWCWTVKDRDCVNEWLEKTNNRNHYAFLGGNCLDLLCSMPELHDAWQSKIKNYLCDKRIKVLLTLQTGFKLPSWMIDCIAQTQGTIEWLVRKHPAFDDTQKEFLDRIIIYSNVEVDTASQCPLPILFTVVHFHVTSHSAVVNDAMRHGIKSAVISKYGLNYFEQQISVGDCFYAPNEIALVKLINDNIADKKVANNIYNNEGVNEIIKLIGRKN